MFPALLPVLYSFSDLLGTNVHRVSFTVHILQKEALYSTCGTFCAVDCTHIPSPFGIFGIFGRMAQLLAHVSAQGSTGSMIPSVLSGTWSTLVVLFTVTFPLSMYRSQILSTIFMMKDMTCIPLSLLLLV